MTYGRHSIKVGFHIHIADGKDADTIKTIGLRHIKKNRIEILKKKSLRVLKWKIKSGYNADDFYYGLITIVCTGFAYKVPRIIKNILLKKYELRNTEH